MNKIKSKTQKVKAKIYSNPQLVNFDVFVQNLNYTHTNYKPIDIFYHIGGKILNTKTGEWKNEK